jgi:hypothetical protein
MAYQNSKYSEQQSQQLDVTALTTGDDNSCTYSGATSTTSSITTIFSCWTGTHVQSEEMKDWILLDNESNTSIFRNRNYVIVIKKEKFPVNIATYGGGLSTSLTETVQGLSEQSGVH